MATKSPNWNPQGICDKCESCSADEKEKIQDWYKRDVADEHGTLANELPRARDGMMNAWTSGNLYIACGGGDCDSSILGQFGSYCDKPLINLCTSDEKKLRATFVHELVHAAGGNNELDAEAVEWRLFANDGATGPSGDRWCRFRMQTFAFQGNVNERVGQYVIWSSETGEVWARDEQNGSIVKGKRLFKSTQWKFDYCGPMAWQPSVSLEGGMSPAVAMSRDGWIVHLFVHGLWTLHYRVGRRTTIPDALDTIEWGPNLSLRENGLEPAVAMDNRGNVLQVHKSEGRNHLFWRTGTLDVSSSSKDDWKVCWQPHSTGLEDGRQPTVAMDDEGNIVQLHSGPIILELFYRVGKLRDGGHVDWGASGHVERGHEPSVALDSRGNVLQLHVSHREAALWYRSGRLNVDAKTIRWNDDSHKVERGIEPAVALDDNGNVVQIHTAQGGLDLWYRPGVFNADSGVVEWGNSCHMEGGHQPVVAMRDYHSGAVQLHTSQRAATVFYSVGEPWTPPLTFEQRILQFWDSDLGAGKRALGLIEYGRNGGGFGPLWVSRDMGEGPWAVAWLAVSSDRSGRRNVLQFYERRDANDRPALGSILYEPNPNGVGYRSLADDSYLNRDPQGLAWLAVDPQGDGLTSVLQPFAAKDQNDAEVLGMALYSPTPDGKRYRVAWVNDDMGQGPGALAWLCVDPAGTGRTHVLQPFAAYGGGLGMILYRPQPPAFERYEVGWVSSDVAPEPGAKAWLVVDPKATGTDSVLQLRANGNALGMTLYAPDGDGYREAWRQDDMGQGPWAEAWFPVSMPCCGGRHTHVLQFWKNEMNRLGVIVYQPKEDGYAVGRVYRDIGEPADAVAWLTFDHAQHGTQIIQIRNVNDRVCMTQYGADADGGYQVVGRQIFQQGSGAVAWLAVPPQ